MRAHASTLAHIHAHTHTYTQTRTHTHTAIHTVAEASIQGRPIANKTLQLRARATAINRLIGWWGWVRSQGNVLASCACCVLGYRQPNGTAVHDARRHPGAWIILTLIGVNAYLVNSSGRYPVLRLEHLFSSQSRGIRCVRTGTKFLSICTNSTIAHNL